MSASVRRLTSRRVSGLSCRSLSTGGDGGGIQGGMNFENGGQLGKLQQFEDQIAGGSQRDRAQARLRRQGNGYECSEASGVDQFHATEVDHDSTGLGRELGKFAFQTPVVSTFSYAAEPLRR